MFKFPGLTLALVIIFLGSIAGGLWAGVGDIDIFGDAIGDYVILIAFVIGALAFLRYIYEKYMQ